jgi:transcriptional regulator with XRE-family HTH domain
MKKQNHLPIPVIKALHKLGKDINNARRRRRISIQLMAERAGISRGTIGKIEKGDQSVSIGGYAAVLFVLGMTDRLGDLVDITYDLVGQELDEERLPQRIRIPKDNGDNDG